MKLNWNFLGGEGIQNDKPSVGPGVWIFSGTTHVCNLSKQVLLNGFLLVTGNEFSKETLLLLTISI